MKKCIVILAALNFIVFQSLSQKKYNTEALSNMIVCVGDLNGNQVRWLGTATIISDSSSYFLVTASHVSDSIKGECLLIFRVDQDKPVIIPLSKFMRTSSSRWNNHAEADISAIRISPFDIDSQARLRQWSFPRTQVLREKIAIPREMTVVAMGYPILDEIGQHFSPLTFNSFFSSGLLTMRRGDTKTKAVFQLLENPSVQGYSGGPVLVGTEKTGISIGWNETVIVGIVHGTYADNTGGKLAMITPAYYIHDLIR